MVIEGWKIGGGSNHLRTGARDYQKTGFESRSPAVLDSVVLKGAIIRITGRRYYILEVKLFIIVN